MSCPFIWLSTDEAALRFKKISDSCNNEPLLNCQWPLTNTQSCVTCIHAVIEVVQVTNSYRRPAGTPDPAPCTRDAGWTPAENHPTQILPGSGPSTCQSAPPTLSPRAATPPPATRRWSGRLVEGSLPSSARVKKKQQRVCSEWAWSGCFGGLRYCFRWEAGGTIDFIWSRYLVT